MNLPSPRRLMYSLAAVVAGLLLIDVAPSAHAQATPEPAVAARIKSAMEGLSQGRQLDEIRSTPVSGLYEVRYGTRIFYVDEQAKYIIDGDLVDLKSLRSLTQERIEELSSIDFGTLPLDLAIKQVNGNGERVIAVFEDANCGYCKRLRADLVKLDNLTIYTFPIAVLGPESDVKARKALCSADPMRAWNELLLDNRVPGNAGTCETKLKQIRELAGKLDVTGTPVVFFANGRRQTGYSPAEQFNKKLDTYSKS